MRGLTFAMVWALWSLPPGAQARDWPKLEGGEGIAECGQAFDLATSAFESGEVYLFAPAALPRNVASAIVLKRNGVDISGGDALEADPAVFEKLDHASGNPLYGQTYWERRPHGSVRLVVREQPHSWRGSTYDIFVIPEALTLEAFAAGAQSEEVRPRSWNKWHPPLVLRNAQSGGSWLIDMDGDVLGDWPVLIVGGAAPACIVHFRPPAESGDKLLPRAVQALASMVDGTLGDGRNEGTLQSTGRRQVHLSHLWANAALRPWALTDSAYNTRAEVDHGLVRWSRQAPTFRAAHDALIAQYPVAEDSLAAYYERQFGFAPAQAREMAAFALDLAYRSAYVFRVGERASQRRNPNPWPAGFYGAR